MSKLFGLSVVAVMCFAVPFASGQGRGKGGEKKPGGEQERNEHPSGGNQGRSGGGKPPGGNWSESKQQPNQYHAAGGEAHKNNSPQESGAAAGAAHKNNSSQASGAEGAAAGAAASNRNNPQASGAEGAAAGAAAANRNNPKASGAEGAAAGAAEANRNNPKASGAEGAAAGAAAANRNNPSVSGAQGAAAGAAAANRNNPQVSGAAGATAGYAAVRNSFDRHDLYGQDWHGNHPGAWTAAGWDAGHEWNATAWTSVAALCSYGTTTPVYYSYGTNVTCVDGNILLDGTSLGSAEDFSQQASDLAQAGIDAKTTDSDKWLPLGVFAMVRNDQQHPQLILQMAVNPQGVLRGNYTDEATDNTLPIRGKVDPKTQRAAWIVGDNNSSVMEAGLTNLTQGEAPALIHKNGKTDRWQLVRLAQPK